MISPERPNTVIVDEEAHIVGDFSNSLRDFSGNKICNPENDEPQDDPDEDSEKRAGEKERSRSKEKSNTFFN